MPSAYTSKIHEGQDISVEEFILTCARAFGAYVTMRDDSLNTKAPEEFHPDYHYLNRLNESLKKLEKLKSMDVQKIQETINRDYEETMKHYQTKKVELISMQNRYNDMLEKVSSWTPPTEEHIPLKDFCVSQLKESMSFDCSSIDYYDTEKVVKVTPEEWLSSKEEELLKDIDYYAKKWEEEVKRVEGRNKWIKQLHDSLKEHS